MDELWERLTLGELLAKHGGTIKTGPFGTALKAAEYSSTGVPLISTGEVAYGELRVTAKTPRVNAATTRRLPEYVLRAGDIVFARKGSIDRSAAVKALEDGYFLGSDGLRVRLGDGLDPRFFGYQMQSPGTRQWLIQHAAGTTMPSLNQGILSRIPLVVPRLSEQQRIAGVLGALDELIDSNTRLADHLEGLLHAMFAQAGFDIPGDNDTVLADFIEVNPRLPKPATVAPYVDMAALPTTRARVQSIVHRQPAGGARFQNGDTLLARITPCLENGKTAFIDALEPNEIGIGSTEFIVLRSTGILGSHWSYFLARSTRFRDYAIRHMSGTSGRQRCSADAIGRYPIAPPEADEATRFAATATEMFAAMKDLDEEARMAARTRDELLPLLLSGRVRVDEVAG